MNFEKFENLVVPVLCVAIICGIIGTMIFGG